MEENIAIVNNMRELLDSIKREAPNGEPCWTARELMEALGYDTWQSFENAISRAMMACEVSGVPVDHQFIDTTKLVNTGSGAQRAIKDFVLSKYACYLIAMNGDTSKPKIAAAQTYFAVQTHRQESQDALTEEERRLVLRNRVKDANRKLGGAAKEAGVRTEMFGVFHNEGYKGLYGGLGLRDIKAVKGLSQKEDLLDRIGRAELAANEFRITQTEEQLNKGVNGEQAAIKTHYAIGHKVRETIREIGGTMPEKLAAEPSIKKLEQRQRKALRAKNKN